MDATTFELDTLLNRFVDGDDTVAANRIEVLLSDLFPGDETSALAISRNTGRAEANVSSMQKKCAPASAACAAISRCRASEDDRYGVVFCPAAFGEQMM
ncbi:hypothetical protein [Aminobacter aminovorans]|uniref:hypothetical protein n=1 Tax=Aminobacter aminovorans TaxID=83263 RepID=UPI000E2047E0|nr:hypothetical protein [Aminobacter aminovorans]